LQRDINSASRYKWTSRGPDVLVLRRHHNWCPYPKSELRSPGLSQRCGRGSKGRTVTKRSGKIPSVSAGLPRGLTLPTTNHSSPIAPRLPFPGPIRTGSAMLSRAGRTRGSRGI
jgi:hypothetical protein